MENGVIFYSPSSVGNFSSMLNVGSEGMEVVAPAAAKTTKQIKEENIAARAFKRENEREVQKTVIALEARNIKRQFLCVVIFGVIMLCITLLMACVSFGTPEWRVYKVGDGFNAAFTPDIFPCRKDSSLNTCQFRLSRKRGLFSTCYKDGSMKSIPSIVNAAYPSSVFTLPYIGGMSCVWQLKYNIQNTPIVIKDNCDQSSNTDYSSLADLNTNLMRAHWMCFALAVLLLALALALALISFRYLRVAGLIWAGAFTLVATLLLVTGMGLFHGYINIEENQLKCPPFYAVLKKNTYSNLEKNTSIRFGYSFWLGWISAFTGLVSCSYLLAAACRKRSSLVVIDKAMGRLKDLNKDEKIDKKYEAMQEKIQRKEAEYELKMAEKMLKRKKMHLEGQAKKAQQKRKEHEAALERLRTEKLEMENKYEMFEEKSEARLQMIEEKMRNDLEQEKIMLEMEKQRVIEEAKEREKNSKKRKNQQGSKRIRWLGKLKSPFKKRHHSDDSCSSSDEEQDGYQRRSRNVNVYHRRSASIDGSNKRSSRMESCGNPCALPLPPTDASYDPYTLRLPTGVNRY